MSLDTIKLPFMKHYMSVAYEIAILNHYMSVACEISIVNHYMSASNVKLPFMTTKWQ